MNARDGDGYTATVVLRCFFCDQQHEGLEAAVDLLLRSGAEEMALDEEGRTVAECLSEPFADEEESQRFARRDRAGARRQARK